MSFLPNLPPWALSATLAMLASLGVSGVAHPRSEEVRSYCSSPGSIWKRAQQGARTRYCGLVLQARASLPHRPSAAQEKAREAAALLPEGWESQLVLAESLLLQKRPQESHRLFAAVFSKLAPSQLGALWAGSHVAAARAALLCADYPRALTLYRRAVLALSDVAGARQRARVLMEAATAAMYTTPPRGREARSYLESALRQNAPLLEPLIVASWTASFARDGQQERARRRAAAFDSCWGIQYLVTQSAPSFGADQDVLPVLPPGEGMALAATLGSLVDPDCLPAVTDAYFEAVSEEQVPEHILQQLQGFRGE